MQPEEIILLPPIHLVGVSLRHRMTNPQTHHLWKSFRPRVGEIEGRLGGDFYSVTVLDHAQGERLSDLNPAMEYQQWAAVLVDPAAPVPNGLERLTLLEAWYAKFIHHGPAHRFGHTIQQILQVWLPSSRYQLAPHPNFEIMGPDYRVDAPDAQEEVYIPVVKS